MEPIEYFIKFGEYSVAIIEYSATAISLGLDDAKVWFAAFSEYVISLGVEQQTLDLIVIGVGVSVLILLLALLRGFWNLITGGGGRRRRRGEYYADDVHTMARSNVIDKDSLKKLNDIQDDMVTLKELYESGEIKLDVYIRDSKALYEKAKKLI
jgi:hypothetical protein